MIKTAVGVRKRITGIRKAQRILVAASAVALAVAVDRRIQVSVDTPKFVIFVVVAAALCGLELFARASYRGDRDRTAVPFAVRGPTWAAIAFGAAIIVTTVASTSPRMSIWGGYPRYAGLLFYGAFSLTWWVVARAFGTRSAYSAFLGVTLAAAAISAYAIVQGLGVDPLQWQETRFGGAFSTLGNPNILSGFSAVALPLCIAVGVACPGWRRWLAAASVALLFAALYFAKSVQGPVALVIGLAVMAGVALRGRSGPEGSARWLPLARLAPVVTVALVVAGLVWANSAFPRFVDQGLVERRYFYQSAWDLFTERPILGTGLGTFGMLFSANRPVGHAQLVGSDTADSVHSIPLTMLAEGGVVLFLAYMAFVGTVGWVAIVLVRRHAGDVTVGALTGAWVGLQVQSLVSVESAILAFLHALIAGLLVARLREDSAEPDDARARSSRRTHAMRRPRRRHAGASIAIRMGAVAFPLLLLWAALVPYRAEFAITAAAAASRAGDLEGAEAAFEGAHALMPHVGAYYNTHAKVLEEAGDLERALEILARGADADPGSVSNAAAAGQIAALLGRDSEARAFYDLALQRDPHNPVVLRFAADHRLAVGDAAGAVALYERVLLVQPENTEVATALDRARDQMEDASR